MIQYFLHLPLPVQALIAGLICFGCTSIGAAFAFFFKNVKPGIMTALLALASGIMIASSFFGLLSPAVDFAKNQDFAYISIAIGFLFGGLFIILSDKLLDNLLNKKHLNKYKVFKKSILFTSSITLHNIPEGMAIGVAFGSLSIALPEMSPVSVLLLAVGIGIQNIPDGLAVSLPLINDGMKPKKAFIIGTLSGIVEPIFAVIACYISTFAISVMPFLLSFAAGTMIAVSVCELIPEAIKYNKNLATLFLIIGFSLMAVLDIAFG